MDANIDSGAIGLFPLNALDVDNKLFSVHLHHLAHLLPLEVTTHHLPKTKGKLSSTAFTGLRCPAVKGPCCWLNLPL